MSDGQRNKTVLGPDCRISGELALDNDAVIMGRFSGTLRVTGLLELTETAEISGTIVAGSLRLAGHAEADVIAEHGVELLPGAQLTGQLFTTTIAVAEGATFEGEVHVGPGAVASASEALAAGRQTSSPEPATDRGPRVVAGSVNQILQRRRDKAMASRHLVPHDNDD